MEKKLSDIEFNFETVSPKEQGIYLKALEKLEKNIVLQTAPNQADKVPQVFIPSEIALLLLSDFHKSLCEITQQ